jgi:hypothetical protein
MGLVFASYRRVGDAPRVCVRAGMHAALAGFAIPFQKVLLLHFIL